MKTSRLLRVMPYICAVAFFLGAECEFSDGAPLSPGSTITLHGDSVSAPSSDGTQVAQSFERISGIFPADNSVQFFATLETDVIRESSGTLDFYYRLANPNSSDIQVLEECLLTGYVGATTNADFVNDGSSSIYPLSANRNATGDVVTFSSFPFERLPAGQSTTFLAVKTDATIFAQNGTITLNFYDDAGETGRAPASATAQTEIFVPVAAPEPATAWALTAPLLLFLIHRHQKKAASAASV